MLLQLTIKNFALIEELEFDLSDGLNILTGETGAGKSMIIDALDMLLGGRASSDYIRDGKDKSVIEASFLIKNNDAVKHTLKELGFETERDKIILTRELRNSGNNKSRINGRIVTLDMTREISQYLIDIYGQHEHQSLLDSQNHLELLDDFGGEKLKEIKEEVKHIYQKLKDKRKKLNSIEKNAQKRDEKIDLLEFQIDEIESAELEIGELEDLLTEKKRLINAEKINEILAKGYNSLYESDMHQEAIMDKLGVLKKDLATIIDFDDQLKDIHQALESVIYQIEDIAVGMSDYVDKIEFNPQRLKVIEQRLELINKLKRKYGDSIEEILAYFKNKKQELKSLKQANNNNQKLEQEVDELEKQYLKLANKLSQLRQDVAKKLEDEAMAELNDLAMDDIRFKVSFKRLNNYSRVGIDSVEFLISPNPGSALRPLQKIASGGELSRIMLALKIITSDVDQTATLVFDEVDSGIGGRTAKLVANKLAVLAKNYQLLCITHLPQIAALADGHNLIRKRIDNAKTSTELKTLNYKDRIREIARMLDGSLDQTTLGHAEKLIKLGEKQKRNL